MVIGLMGNLLKIQFKELLPELIGELRQRGAEFVLDREVADGINAEPSEIMDAKDIPSKASLILSFGGDGTFLRTAGIIGSRCVPILGVNIGPGLGYLTELGTGELKAHLDQIIAGDYRLEERMMLSARIDGEQNTEYFALNDVVVGHEFISSALPVDVFIDDTPVTTYRCDGIILSTPTGSTAYSLSSGGPIIEPTLDTIIITPISPHTLTMRPVVVSNRRTVRIRPHVEAEMSADGDTVRQLKAGDTIIVGRAPYKTRIAMVMDYDFYHVLRSKLKWGETETIRLQQG